MINLIPKVGKKKILLEYWTRVTSVWFLVWAITLIACTSIVLPVYVQIGSLIKVYEASTVAVAEKVESIENISPDLKAATNQARRIAAESKLRRLSELIALFNELQGAGIKLTDIRLVRQTDNLVAITLEGQSDTRQSLSSFRDRLLADSEIKSVNLPISNLEKESDIKFSLTVELNKTENI